MWCQHCFWEPGLPCGNIQNQYSLAHSGVDSGNSHARGGHTLKKVSPLFTDPCQGVTCRSQETCTEKDGKGICTPDYYSKCWVWGDPHYYSFDGWSSNFHGTCSYLLAGSNCAGVTDKGLTPFTVVTKHESQGNPSVSNVKRVTVSTYNTSIVIHKKEIGRVQVWSHGHPKKARVKISVNKEI